jgi:hypothetical protein
VVKKSQKKFVCMRGIRSDLWAQVRKTAKHEGYFVREWVEAALIHELAQAAEPKSIDLGMHAFVIERPKKPTVQ